MNQLTLEGKPICLHKNTAYCPSATTTICIYCKDCGRHGVKPGDASSGWNP